MIINLCLSSSQKYASHLFPVFHLAFFQSFQFLSSIKSKWITRNGGPRVLVSHDLFSVSSFGLKANTTGWWFQPSGKILVKMGIFPKFRGEDKKSLKPPTRKWCHSHQLGSTAHYVFSTEVVFLNLCETINKKNLREKFSSNFSEVSNVKILWVILFYHPRSWDFSLRELGTPK